MRLILLLLGLLIVAFSTPAFSSGPLPYDPREASCQDVFDNAGHSPQAKMLAASINYNGMLMGKRCPDGPDVIRAFELYSELGMTVQMNTLLRQLTRKSDAGNAYSKSVLRQLKRAGFIE